MDRHVTGESLFFSFYQPSRMEVFPSAVSCKLLFNAPYSGHIIITLEDSGGTGIVPGCPLQPLEEH